MIDDVLKIAKFLHDVQGFTPYYSILRTMQDYPAIGKVEEDWLYYILSI